MFCYQEFYKEAIYDNFIAHSHVFRGRGEGVHMILSDFRELSFCSPTALHCKAYMYIPEGFIIGLS